MSLDRRAVLTGLGAAAVAGRAEAQGDGTALAALDRARMMPAGQALRLLAGIRGAAPNVRLDLGAARAGLAIDAGLAIFPPRDAQRQLLTQLRDAGRPGALRLDNGVRWYALQLRRSFGDIDPVAAERRLRAMLTDLHRRAVPLFDVLGVPGVTPGERFRRLWADDPQLYADTAAGRDTAVADMNATLAALGPKLPALLGSVPPATIRRLSPAEEAAGKGGYRDVQTASYVVDLKHIRRRPRWTLPAVVAHELLPGHMVQLPIEGETPPHPFRLDYASAFVEGWGVYAETLAARLGAYPDPRMQLGHFHWLIFRTGRALVDLGIHLRGWTLAEARARLVDWQGEPAYFAPFDTDLARIAVEPGGRAAEALAWLALVDRAARLRGPALVRFHRAVLAGGRKRLEQLP